MIIFRFGQGYIISHVCVWLGKYVNPLLTHDVLGSIYIQDRFCALIVRCWELKYRTAWSMKSFFASYHSYIIVDIVIGISRKDSMNSLHGNDNTTVCYRSRWWTLQDPLILSSSEMRNPRPYMKSTRLSILVLEDMHMTLFRVRDGFISAQVSEIFHESLGEWKIGDECWDNPYRTRNKAICIFSHDFRCFVQF